MKPDISHIPEMYHDATNVYNKLAQCILFKGIVKLEENGFMIAMEPGGHVPQALVAFIADYLGKVGNPKTRVVLLAHYLSENIELIKWPIDSPWNHDVTSKYPPMMVKKSNKINNLTKRE